MTLSIKVANSKLFGFITFLVMALLLLGQRIAIPVFGTQIPVSFCIAYLYFAILALTFQLKISLMRYFLYSFAICGLIIAIIFTAGDFSLFSFYYLLIMYFPFFFVLKKRDESVFLQTISYFQILMLIASLLALSQIILQLFGIKLSDPFSLLPIEYVQKNYMTTYNYYYSIGISIKKANAFIFLEPSFLSQFSALAFIIEAVYFKKTWRMILYLLALLVSLSGTGLLLLLFGILTIPALRTKKILIIGFFIAIIVISFFPFYFSTLLFSRIAEFNTPASSGHSRFISPYLIMIDMISNSTIALTHGIGPGTVKQFEELLNAAFNPITKIIIEYGIVAGSFFLFFISLSFLYKARNIPISLSLLFVYLFLSGSLLQPQTVYVFYVLNILWPKINRVNYNSIPQIPVTTINL